MSNMEYAVYTTIIVLTAAYVMWQGHKISKLKREKLMEEYKRESLEIEKKISDMSDDDIKSELDKYTKRKGSRSII